MTLSAAEQYALALINRARLDPLAEAERYGVALNDGLDPGQIGDGPLQVLAHNEALSVASEGHSIWMLANDTFSHTGDAQSSAGGRMTAAGYEFMGAWAWRENLAWSGTTGTIDLDSAINHHHRGLYLSAGHRANTFSSDLREIGLTQVEGPFTANGTTYNSSMLTQNFALSGPDVFVTGVAYRDADGDGFYTIGEGLGDVVFGTGQTQDVTSQSGGYGVDMTTQGDVLVTVTQNSTQLAVVQMDVIDGSGKLDLVAQTASDFALHLSTDATLVSGIGDAVLLGAGDLSLRGNSGANTLTGNSGDDVLKGGTGNDALLGGGGADQFFFKKGDDTIRDFQDDVDTIAVEDARLAGSSATVDDLMELGEIVGGDAVFSFGGGHSLTINGVTDLSILADDMILV